jgi:branched-chain amino acid transport system substrate-binding protein
MDAKEAGAVSRFSPRINRIAGISLTAVLLLASGLTGCGRGEAAPVKIGVIYPLSGAQEAVGAEMRHAVELAVDIVNGDFDLDLPLARGSGLPNLNGARLEAVFADSEGTPQGGRAAATRLMESDRVAALMGGYQSAVTAEASLAAEAAGIPFLAETSTAPSLTQRGLTWFFRASPADDVLTRNFFQFLTTVAEDKKGQEITLGLIHENSTWGTELALLEMDYARELGYAIVADVAYDASAPDLDDEVRQLMAANPTAVLQSSYTQDAILLMQTYEKLRFEPEAILANGAGFTDPRFFAELGRQADDIITRELWCPDLAAGKPLAGTVNQLFRDRFGMDMDGNSARAFTGLLILADAINRAADTAPEKVRQALRDTQLGADQLIMPWDGVRFDAKTQQNTLAKGIICQRQGEQFHTIWPRQLQSRDFVWPRPWPVSALRVAVVVSNPEDDFNRSGLAGARRAAADFGGEMEYQVADSSAGEEALFNDYASSGRYSLIIAMGGAQTPALLKVAAHYPRQKFALVDGDVTEQPNIVSLHFRDEESSFLAGALASVMSYTGKIGFIGGMDIPAIHRFQAGYTAGALYVNENCDVMVGYTGTWDDPEVGRQLALDQYGRGADIVFGAAGLSSQGILTAAEQHNFWAIGVDSDQRYRAPDYVLVSTLKAVDVVVYDVIRAVRVGTFTAGLRSFGLTEGGVGISLDNSLPEVTDEIRQYINQVRVGIIAGAIKVPSK